MAYKSFQTKVLFYFLQSFLICKSFNLVESGSSFFVKMPFLLLDGDIVITISVLNIFECGWRCNRVSSCLSLNIADQPGADGLKECQLLKTWAANQYSGLIKPSQHYHHYTRLTEVCMANKCLNGGTCEVVEYDVFQCRCPREFKGKRCEETAYNWLKINSNPVCFGAKDSSFGRFYFNQTGSVRGIKLVHLSGYVAPTDAIEHQSNWGSAQLDTLYTIITNGDNHKIFPHDEFIIDTDILSYKLPYASFNSPELIFKNFTGPMMVTAGQEYRIWFGEDLNNYGEEDNVGTSCVDVYALALFD